mmetsp:Transcript_11050/g.31491  ORF Transcript_11050/g.31491 Transcript_11050/m.31491 type:complete len:200 (+) Transcript_11050:84-683(+)
MKLFRLPLHFSLLVFVDSFYVQSTIGNVRKMMSMSNSDQVEQQGISRRKFAHVFGGMTFVSIFVNAPKEAMAFQPSSMTLSDAIKTLDFSLPSYDAISSSKASVDTVEGLAEQYVQEAVTVPSRKKTKEPKASSGGNPMGSLLPSMNKGTAKTPRAKPAPAPKPAPKEKEEKGPIIETMDLSLPSYDAGATREKSIFSI